MTLAEWYTAMIQAERLVRNAREMLARAEAVREALFTTVDIEDDGVDAEADKVHSAAAGE
jgi:hypothetical protein